MDFFLFLFLHPSSFCLETPLWIRDSPLFRFLVAVSWGRGVLYLSAISIIISTFIRLHSLRSSDHFWALPASNVHLPAFTAVFVLHSLSRLPPPLPRSVQHFPTSVTGAWTLPLSVLDDLHLRGCRIWTRDLCHCSLALYHLSHPSPVWAPHPPSEPPIPQSEPPSKNYRIFCFMKTTEFSVLRKLQNIMLRKNFRIFCLAKTIEYVV